MVADDELLAVARQTLDIEAAALQSLKVTLARPFIEAVRVIQKCEGKVVVLGVGKSGHIGRKIAATLASTGTPAFFVHPTEAGHGDLGMIAPRDVVLALSNSGETDELVALVPYIRRLGAHLIGITANAMSTLGANAHICLTVKVAQEACPLNLAPTASTTAQLAMGDALAMALLKARGFEADDFARSHPGGALGRRLLTTVDDVMKTGAALPIVAPDMTLDATLAVMSEKGLGLCMVLEGRRAIGIFTDGDLRRQLRAGAVDLQAPVSAFMIAAPRTIAQGRLAVDALNELQARKINAIGVTDVNGDLQGIVTLHGLIAAKIL